MNGLPADPLLEAMRRQARRMVADAFGATGATGAVEHVGQTADASDGFVPFAELCETDDAYQLTVEVPGIAAGEIEVRVEGHTVTVTGERQERTPTGTVHWRTRRIGRFRLEVVLPEAPDPTTLAVSAEHGELVIRLAKQ